ncbi:cytidine deaminase [Desulfallas thermosapovorans]|uniref:Cytidine deaminase n=1 Tax=Desulfallas thermosapovorans DSM 6562 TaxID=1121431 RepID=A0A5S4ZWS7_9FIRM|nr:cytidine deaminase [Desulfallas thermosapovorans]TYO97269.1 cytidine deaminase [Desulfallas thermosapovorans DSM 6562]
MKPEQLVALALEARQNAYVPYSNFAVGAALLTTGGRVYTGCNVENSSYGLTVCAERVALFTAVANGERKFAALAVAAGTEEYCSPCGACRQVLAEFDTGTRVYLANRHGAYRETTVAELLPSAFSLSTRI